MQQVKKFNELNVVSDRKIFSCNQVSINDIVNVEIVVIDAVIQGTKNGERALVYCRDNKGIESKFFSGSKGIMEVVGKLQCGDFPFSTIVKCTQFGKGKMYQFT